MRGFYGWGKNLVVKNRGIGLIAVVVFFASVLMTSSPSVAETPNTPHRVTSPRVTAMSASGETIDVIITFDKAPQSYYPALLQDLLGDLGTTIRYELTNVVTASVTATQLTQLEGLASKFGIVSVSYNRPLTASELQPATTISPTHSAAGFTGLGTTIAILDTGVDIGHDALDNGKVVAFHDARGGNWAGCPTHSTAVSYDDDTIGHGTHVASTAAGNGANFQGVAPGASIVSVKVLDCAGGGTEADLNEGIAWVLQNRNNFGGIDVANISIEGTSCSSGSFDTGGSLNTLASVGIVPVVAAGNHGPGNCSVTFPGDAVNALTVGAVGSFGTIGSFSGRGPTATGAIKPDLTAPGIGIVAAQVGTFDSYNAKTGTSMATPHVAGIALLLIEKAPGASVNDIRSALTSTATDAGEAGRDNTYGYGIVDAEAALSAIEGISNAFSVAALDPLEPGPGEIRVRGWSYDPDFRDFTQVVHVYAFFDGADTPVALDTPVVRTSFPRPDVNTNFGITGTHGFNRTLQIRPGNHRVCVYSISVTSTGATDDLNALIGCRDVTIQDQAPPRGVVDAVARSGDQVTMNGWAYDLDAILSGVPVHVYVDGVFQTAVNANEQRSDINEILAIDGDHGFASTFSVPAGPHQVCIYVLGVDPTGTPDGGNVLLSCVDV